MYKLMLALAILVGLGFGGYHGYQYLSGTQPTEVRIEWVSFTGFSGHGQWHSIDKLDEFQANVESLDRRYPELEHWVATR